MYHQYRIETEPTHFEQLIAFLAAAGFDSFQETDEALLAFAAEDKHDEGLRVLDDLRKRYSFTLSYEALPERNWNEVWESQFEPIRIGDQLQIRASFHPEVPNIVHDLVIDPKMAFGTGHHATTYMMCELLLEEGAGSRVLDYGAGTGVLAILAKRLGADRVEAIDLEPAAVENTEENARLNGVRLDRNLLGELSLLPAAPPYDLILANINRNVILANADALYKRLQPGGKVYFSGVLAKDEKLLIDRLTTLGFRHLQTRQREDWRAFVFTRS